MTIVRPESPGEIRHGRDCPTSAAEAPPMLPTIRAAPQPASATSVVNNAKYGSMKLWLLLNLRLPFVWQRTA